jgi:stalled ribosome alternative rescue factor ArfA
MRKPPKPRNPMALELRTNPLFRKRVGLSSKERAEKHERDSWNRKAKHKGINTSPD